MSWHIGGQAVPREQDTCRLSRVALQEDRRSWTGIWWEIKQSKAVDGLRIFSSTELFKTLALALFGLYNKCFLRNKFFNMWIIEAIIYLALEGRGGLEAKGCDFHNLLLYHTCMLTPQVRPKVIHLIQFITSSSSHPAVSNKVWRQWQQLALSFVHNIKYSEAYCYWWWRFHLIMINGHC